jgi:hypothetical protein
MVGMVHPLAAVLGVLTAVTGAAMAFRVLDWHNRRREYSRQASRNSQAVDSRF